MVQSQSPELFDWVIMFSIDLIIFFVHTGEEEVGSSFPLVLILISVFPILLRSTNVLL